MPHSTLINVISRKSKLALLQVEEVFQLYPHINYRLIEQESFGDKNKQLSLLDSHPADIFTRELDEAVLSGIADIAIHSAKDLPYPLSEGLEVIALTEASDQTDALASRGNIELAELPPNNRIGTSSPLRKKELLQLRPDIQIVPVRGTIEERLSLIDKGETDALVVATCALKRLGLKEHITQILPFETHPLQGNLAIVARKERPDLKALFSSQNIINGYGKVTLVGFGPGNPDLLTIAGEHAIKKAEIIFYDDLLDKDYLKDFTATLIYVGKRSGQHSKSQDEINRLMLESARKGNNVVRLKGGDPMIFAHGGEEVEYLQSNFIQVEVIPGISTGNAMAALSKISLTYRNIASSVAFVSGHSPNIQVPNADTLVYYMGASNLRNIAREVIAQGRKPETPVMLVYHVSLDDQKEYFTTLQELLADKTLYPTPLIIVIGDVVGLRHHSGKELAKQNVLVTGTTSEEYAHLGNIIHTPLIEIKGYEENYELYQVIEDLSSFDYLLFTSRHAVHYFFDSLKKKNLDGRKLFGLRIFSIGRTTSNELHKHGITPDVQVEEQDSYGVINAFSEEKASAANVLIPRSDIALDIIPEGLRLLGLNVKTVKAYRNVLPENAIKVNLSYIESIVFSSPSCVDNFLKLYGKIPNETTIYAKGRVTRKHLEEKGITSINIL